VVLFGVDKGADGVAGAAIVPAVGAEKDDFHISSPLGLRAGSLPGLPLRLSSKTDYEENIASDIRFARGKMNSGEYGCNSNKNDEGQKTLKGG
jgi:hypothetical protein